MPAVVATHLARHACVEALRDASKELETTVDDESALAAETFLDHYALGGHDAPHGHACMSTAASACASYAKRQVAPRCAATSARWCGGRSEAHAVGGRAGMGRS